MYKASIDKIRLKLKLRENKILDKGKTPYIYDALVAKYDVPEYIEYLDEPIESLARYRYRWSVSLRIVDEKEGTLWLGMGYNENLTDERKLCVEFNPNKSGVRIFEWLRFTFNLEITSIVNCDVAFDVPNVDVADVTLNTTADVMTYGTVKNKTLYIAPKGENRIKVYQKNIERENVGVDMAKTLRIEISLKGEWLSYNNTANADTDKIMACINRLNSVSWIDNVNSTDVTLYLLLNSPTDVRKTALSLMSSATRAKYRKMLQAQSNTLNLDYLTFCDLMHILLKPYLRGIKIK